jgi:hypothetical protein
MKFILFALIIIVATTVFNTSGQAQSYPWCAQGENLRCYYVTREQCEEAVDYHGFCVANSNVPTRNEEAPQPRRR